MNSLSIDGKDNLFGTTYGGGNGNAGVAFELSPPSTLGGTWNYSVLYNFCSVGPYCQDGAVPHSPLTIDRSGNLYGTTSMGGQYEGMYQYVDGGTVFELSPASSGWTESVLYSFCAVYQNSSCLDGQFPLQGVTFDKLGNLYGTTSGEFLVDSIVWSKLSPGAVGWQETVPLEFPRPGGNRPGPVSIDPKSSLYTTFAADVGRFIDSSVIRRGARGGVQTFHFTGNDGVGPTTGVIIDPVRDVLYGTTITSLFGHGNIFQIDETGTETVLYTFCNGDSCPDGSLPGGLLEDNLGNLYGVTNGGGNVGYNYGVVFELTP